MYKNFIKQLEILCMCIVHICKMVLSVPVPETFDINCKGYGGGRGGYDDRRGGGYGGERRERKLSDNKEDFREPTAGTLMTTFFCL